MNTKYEIETSTHPDGKIVLEVFLTRDDIRESITRMIIETQDEQIKGALISLGWTPPYEDKRPPCFGKQLGVESCHCSCPVSDECYEQQI